MATLFENIGGAFKHEPTELERVEANIAQVEAEMKQRMMQLGQMFYRDYQNRENVEADYKVIMDMIGKLDENRKGFYNHKLRLEGNMVCVNCGQIIPYGSVFCANCGKRADVKEDGAKDEIQTDGMPEEKVCSKCNTVFKNPEAKFCAVCGTPIE